MDNSTRHTLVMQNDYIYKIQNQWIGYKCRLVMRIYCAVNVLSNRTRNPVLGTSQSALHFSPWQTCYSKAMSVCMENMQPRCNYCANNMHSHIHNYMYAVKYSFVEMSEH